MAGHTFVVQGDLLKIACDEILVPTDASGIVTPAWKSLGTPTLPDRWGDDGVRVTAVADRLGHHIRWVNTGGVPSSAEARIGWLRDGVRSGLQAAAADLGDRRPLYKRAKHLIGLPLFGTGEGGFDGIRGAAINGLLSVCDEVARDRDVDVVLTSRHRSDYAALQSQRRDIARFDSLSRNLLSKADDLGRQMAANEVAFFLGAGISVPAGIPSWKELISRLAERSSAYRDRAKDLGEIAAPDAALLLYRDDEHNFRASLAEALKSPVHALGHALVASMRPAEVISTNFDDLFEQAAASTYEESLTVLWTVSVPASWDPLSIIQVAAGSGRRLHNRSLFGGRRLGRHSHRRTSRRHGHPREVRAQANRSTVA